MTQSRSYVLAAGGTGGHMVPAAALAAELAERGHHVALVSDDRGVRFPGLFEGVETHVLPAGRLGGGPLGYLRAASRIMTGRSMALRLYKEIQPAAVIGFGGYPALPALLAAFRAGVPTVIHEQNAVLGRVNRFVAGRVDAIATSYDQVDRVKPGWQARIHLVGNPVREAVLNLRNRPYPLLEEDGIFRVLVTGGSQGATVLSQVVPDGLALLPVHFRRRLQVTHQARVEDIETVRAKYQNHGIPADVSTYITDMADVLAWSHIVIAPGDPGAAAQRHRRSPDRQCPRDHCGRRRADHPAARLHRGGTRQADPEARARHGRARECRGAGAQRGPSQRHARPRRSRRIHPRAGGSDRDPPRGNAGKASVRMSEFGA